MAEINVCHLILMNMVNQFVSHPVLANNTIVLLLVDLTNKQCHCFIINNWSQFLQYFSYTKVPLYYTPRKRSFGGYIEICLSVCVRPSVHLSGPTSKSVVRFPPNFVEFKIMMCELCSIKGFYCPLSFTPVMLLWT